MPQLRETNIAGFSFFFSRNYCPKNIHLKTKAYLPRKEGDFVANSEDLQTLLRDSLLNNSYDWDAMHNQLKRTWMRSFSYLYSLQKSYINYDELRYFTSDATGHDKTLVGQLYLDKSLHARFDIDKDLIHPTARKAYRSSDYFQNLFSVEDIVANPNIFMRMPIVIIDDRVIWDYNIYANGDKTTFILPFKRDFVLENERHPETDDVVYKDHKIEVLIIDTCYYERLQVSIGTDVYYNTHSKELRIPKELCSKTPTFNGQMMLSIHVPNRYGNGYELGSEMILLENDELYYSARLDEFAANLIENAPQDVLLSCFFIRHLNTHTMYNRSDILIEEGVFNAPLFVLEESNHKHYDNPIPVENMMVLKKGPTDSAFTLIKSTDAIKMYYPNIYEIIDPYKKEGDLYKVLYFYYEDSTDLRYTYLFDFFYMYLYRIFPGISTEEIVNILYYKKSYVPSSVYRNFNTTERNLLFKRFNQTLNYQWYEHDYTENDFINDYLPQPGNEGKVGVEYQDETLKKWIRVEPWVLKEYVLSQKKLSKTFCLYTKEIDLASRLRRDTSQEFPHTSIPFTEDRYLFAFANDGHNGRPMSIRFFCDGIFVEDIYQRRKNYMDLFYVPTRFITNDSYLEIEILPDYSFSQEVTFDYTGDTKEVVFNEPEDVVFPTVADYYATEKLTDDEGEYEVRYEHGLFHITEHYSRGDFQVTTTDPDKPVEFTRIKKHSISADSMLTGHTVNLTITKRPHIFKYTTKRDGYVYLEFVTGEHDWNFNLNYMRIFVNGRLYPREFVSFQGRFENPRLFFYKKFDKDTLITIDITPYQYKEICYIKDIYTAQPHSTRVSFSTNPDERRNIYIEFLPHIDPHHDDEDISTDDDLDSVLVDLSEVINKPFDIRYYEVYMNGRKLSLDSVFAISDYRIRLVNLKSLHNFVIYEKERDYEWYGLDYREEIYPYTIDQMFLDAFMSTRERDLIIGDIINNLKDSRLTIKENTDDEEYEYYELDPSEVYAIQMMFFYYDELISRNYAFADHIQYLEQILKDYYTGVYVNYFTKTSKYSWDAESKARHERYPGVVLMNAETVVAGDYSEGGTYIDDDTNASDNSSDEEDKPLYVYTIGYPDHVDQEQLDDAIVVPTNPEQMLPIV